MHPGLLKDIVDLVSKIFEGIEFNGYFRQEFLLDEVLLQFGLCRPNFFLLVHDRVVGIVSA